MRGSPQGPAARGIRSLNRSRVLYAKPFRRDRSSELSPLQPGARAPMREAPGGFDRRKLLHVAVYVPDPACGPKRAAGNRAPPHPVAGEVLVEPMGGMSRLEDAQPETEIVIRLVLHGNVAGDVAVDERGEGGD